MRRIVFPVLLLIASIIIGVALLVIRPQSMWAPVSAALTGKTPDKTGSLPKPLAKKGGGEKSRLARPQADSNGLLGSVTVTVVPSPAADTPRGFPLAGEIVNGTPKSAVLANFVTPTATVVGTDAGQIMERFVYVDRPGRRTTSIYLADGKVIRAETSFQ